MRGDIIMEGKLCVTVEEMGELLGIGRTKAYDVARRADFPTIRLGNRMLIPKKALEAWLERQVGGLEKVG